MGIVALLRTSRPPATETRSLAVSDWGSYVELVTGGTITDERARRAAAAYACIDVLSSSTGTTPIDVVETVGGHHRPASSPLIDSPSVLVQPDVWRYQAVESMATDGNAFGLIGADPTARWAETIELVDPSIVTNRTVVGGVAQVTIDGTVHRRWPHGDLWHVPGKMVRAGSPWGRSPLADAASSIRTSLAAEDYTEQFFAGGGHPTTFIRSKSMLTADQAAAIKTGWRRMLATSNGRHDPAVVGGDLEVEQVQTSPKDAQPVDLLRFEIEQQCRFWRVPPSMVFAAVSGQNVTYANVAQYDLAFLKHSLNVYLVRLEGALNQVLPPTQSAKFNRNAILQSDPLGRMQIHQIRLANKLATVNEIRELEDDAPFDDPAYDEPGVPGGAPASAPTTDPGAH